METELSWNVDNVGGKVHQRDKEQNGRRKTEFYNVKIICNKPLSLGVRKIILEYYVKLILTHGCGSWAISKQATKFPETSEM